MSNDTVMALLQYDGSSEITSTFLAIAFVYWSQKAVVELLFRKITLQPLWISACSCDTWVATLLLEFWTMKLLFAFPCAASGAIICLNAVTSPCW